MTLLGTSLLTLENPTQIWLQIDGFLRQFVPHKLLRRIPHKRSVDSLRTCVAYAVGTYRGVAMADTVICKELRQDKYVSVANYLENKRFFKFDYSVYEMNQTIQ